MARTVTTALLSLLVAAAVVALLYYGLRLQSRAAETVTERFAEKTISPKVITDLYDTTDALDAAILDKVDQLAYNREVDGIHQVQDVTARELGELKSVVVPLKPIPDALNALSSSLTTVQQALATKGSVADTVMLTKDLLRLSTHLDALVDEVTAGDRNLTDDMLFVRASLTTGDTRLTDLTSQIVKAKDAVDKTTAGLAKADAQRPIDLAAYSKELHGGLAAYGKDLQDAKTSLAASIEQLKNNVPSSSSLDITVKRLDAAMKGIADKLASDMTGAVRKADFDALKATAAKQSDYAALNNNYGAMNTQLSATSASLKKLTDMGDLTKMTDFASLRDAHHVLATKYEPMHADYTTNGFVPKNAFATLEKNYNTTAGKVDAISKLGDLDTVFARKGEFGNLSKQVDDLSKRGIAPASAASDGGLLANLAKLNKLEQDVTRVEGVIAAKVSNTDFQDEKSKITIMQSYVDRLVEKTEGVAKTADVDTKVASLKTMLQDDRATIAAGGLSRLCMDGRCLDGTAVNKLKAFGDASSYTPRTELRTELNTLRASMATPNAAGGLNQLCIGPECVTADQLRTMKSPPAAAAFSGTVTNGILVNKGNPGPLIETQYGTSKGDRYGVGQFVDGATRTYAATAHAPATVNMSFAKGDGSFNDVLTARNNGRIDVPGQLVVSPEPGGVAPAQGFMGPGSLTVGSVSRNYGQGTGGWNNNTAGIMMECADKTEIAVHDAGLRVASMMSYDGPANQISVGRNMGWGPSDFVVARHMGVNGSATVAGNSTVSGSSTVSGNSTVSGSSTVNGNSTVTGQMEASGIRFSRNWTGAPDSVSSMSEIANDTGGNKQLMIVGNKSGGGVRRVGVWDRLDVNGAHVVNGTSTVSGNSSVGGSSTVSGNSTVSGSSTVTGNATVNGQMEASGIRFSRNWTGAPDSVSSMSEIANDTGGNKQLMIVGNKSGGGVRRVGVWDRLDVNGTHVVTDKAIVSPEPGGWAPANGYMGPGSLTVGSINRNYGQGTGGFNASTAGIMMECADKTEIAVHDAGTRVASMMSYDGPANRIIVGRNMGWGTTDLGVGGKLCVGGTCVDEATFSKMASIANGQAGSLNVNGQVSAHSVRLGGPNGRWVLGQEGDWLVMRDVLIGGDKRIAFPAGRHVNL
jgi:hypothetical protein